MKIKYKSQKKGGKREDLDPRYMDGKWIAYRRQIFRCWYLYVNYLINTKGDKKKVYTDWDILGGNQFKSWWSKNWVRLFSEPTSGNIKIINSVPKKQNNHSMYLEIPINAPESILLSQVKDLLHEEFKKRKLDGKYLFPSNLKYKMEVSKNFQHQVWIKRLECIQLQDEGKTRLQIGKKLNIGDGQGEYCKRQVSRNIELGKKLLKNVEKGKFNVDFVKVKKLVKK